MTDLKVKQCKPCHGGEQPLSIERVTALLSQLPEWKLSADNKEIQRRYKFKGFYRTMAFINAMAWIANNEGHHPDFSAGFNYCLVKFTTHDIDGLSENDFICAAKVDALLND